jgi:dTMP kinase
MAMGKYDGLAGKIICLEGIDGSGKSLQSEMLLERLRAYGYKCAGESFPRYGGYIGREIGAMLSGANAVRADEVDAKSMALWYAVDRWEFFSELAHAGEVYDCLVLNRYTLSNAVYQGLRVAESERAALRGWVFELEHGVLGLPEPDIYIILDMDQGISEDNVRRKGYREYTEGGMDLYERSAAMQLRAREAYLELGAQWRGSPTQVVRCAEGGAILPPETIHERVWALTREI